MSFLDLVLKRETRDRRQRRLKSREFRVTLLGYLAVPWELSGAERVTRPVWIAYAGPDQACRAFTANFRAGRKARAGATDLQVPKSAPHRWVHQRYGDATVTVAYLPGLFHLEPAVPPEEVEFVFLPPSWWLERQVEELRPELGEEALDAARAALFVGFLDRRTSLPIVQDLRFHLQLFRAALDEPWCCDDDRVVEARGLARCGLDRPLWVRVDHGELETFLTAQTNHYFEEEIRRGQTRLDPDRRVLPYPDRAPAQLQLCFEVA